jgi:hypothetical protein
MSEKIFAAIIILTAGALLLFEPAFAQQQGYLCGKMGSNVPNKCRYTVGSGQREGVSTCQLDASDNKVGWYTDCAGGAPEEITIIGGLYACCTVDFTCPGKPKPAYVAGCARPSSSTGGFHAASPPQGLPLDGLPLGFGIGIGGFGHRKPTDSK